MSKRRILAADDSLTIRKFIEMSLGQEGYDVMVAENGSACLQKAREAKPDLILLDYVLPDMQGTEVCQSLINCPETWEIPVLMMSGNGNAIRQLYQDFNNVADYLTKPFAPNVLKAVIGHILSKNAGAATPETAQTAATTPSNATAPEEAKPAAPKPRRATTRRKRTVSTVAVSDNLQAKFRRIATKFLREGLQFIPEWERVRGEEAAESFYATRILSAKIIQEMAAELVRATGFPDHGMGAFRCPVEFAGVDTVLKQLQALRVTGQLNFELEEEVVQLYFREGALVFVTSNHPRNYCAGAACNFHALPHTVIAEAVQAQETHAIPFFVFLREEGHLSDADECATLLRAQGEKAIARAYQCPDVVSAFYPLAKLPSIVRKHETVLSLETALLACYRTVEDWLTIEQSLPDLAATLAAVADYEKRVQTLSLDEEEERLLDLAISGRRIADVLEASGLGTYNGSMVLYRFLKLGLLLARDAEPANVTAPGTSFLVRPHATPAPATSSETARIGSLAELEHATAVN